MRQLNSSGGKEHATVTSILHLHTFLAEPPTASLLTATHGLAVTWRDSFILDQRVPSQLSVRRGQRRKCCITKGSPVPQTIKLEAWRLFCQDTYAQCIANNSKDASAQETCKSNEVCGYEDPADVPQATSSLSPSSSLSSVLSPRLQQVRVCRTLRAYRAHLPQLVDRPPRLLLPPLSPSSSAQASPPSFTFYRRSSRHCRRLHVRRPYNHWPDCSLRLPLSEGEEKSFAKYSRRER